MIILSENFRALFYTPFYAAQATGAYAAEGVDVDIRLSTDPERTAAAAQARFASAVLATDGTVLDL